MPKHDITIQAVVNVRVPAVEAASQEGAIEAALDRVDLYDLFDRCQPAPKVPFTSYAEELRDVLVDEVGDEEYTRSRWFRWQNDRWAPAPAGVQEDLGPPAAKEGPMPGEPLSQETLSLQVIVTVSGGVADVLCKPLGVGLTILDYDVEGCEGDPSVEKDPDGELCATTAQLGPREQIASHEHWPAVKAALNGRYSRLWRCPGCGKKAHWTYEELAEAGAPICTDCDVEMTLV
jgi:hypothetical protein